MNSLINEDKKLDKNYNTYLSSIKDNTNNSKNNCKINKDITFAELLEETKNNLNKIKNKSSNEKLSLSKMLLYEEKTENEFKNIFGINNINEIFESIDSNSKKRKEKLKLILSELYLNNSSKINQFKLKSKIRKNSDEEIPSIGECKESERPKLVRTFICKTKFDMERDSCLKNIDEENNHFSTRSCTYTFISDINNSKFNNDKNTFRKKKKKYFINNEKHNFNLSPSNSKFNTINYIPNTEIIKTKNTFYDNEENIVNQSLCGFFD